MAPVDHKSVMKVANDFLSARVVTVTATQRLSDVANAIIEKDALYCAVVTKSGTFVGLIRLKEIVAKSAERIFSDLLPLASPLDIDAKMEAELAAKLLKAQGADELVVLDRGKRYVGLVTRESLFEWWAQDAVKV